MNRRSFLALSVPVIGLVTPTAWAGDSVGTCGDYTAAREQFLALPGEKSLAITVGGREAALWQENYQPDAKLFIGSAFKTFVLATYLREVEANRLSEDEPLPINDDIRSLSSSVFGDNPDGSKNLTGSASAQTILEAMISHSDNTATDAALLRLGVDKVRAFIASAGLSATAIPDSTRIMFSYLAGAPAGVDEGWAGMKEIIEGHFFGTPRSPINDRETIVSTAAELVSYYQSALSGRFFSQPATLTEFKRIQAMADLIARVLPADTAAYAKGGSIDWQNFHALCAPGQMIVGQNTATFCFTINWHAPDSSVPETIAAAAKAIAGMLAATAQCFG